MPPERALFGEIGSHLDDVVQSPFFRWFQLGREGEQHGPDGSIVEFRPSGPAFHDLAEVRVSAGLDGSIGALELRLARRFIDDTRNGMFAHDIAKSFLRAVFDERNRRSLGGLDEEIEFGGTFAVPVLRRGPQPTMPPGSPTPAYRVFLGRDDRYERGLHGARLLIEELRQPFPPLLRIAVTAGSS